MNGLPLRVRVYVLAVIAAGVAIATAALLSFDVVATRDVIVPLVVFTALYAVAEVLAISVESREVTSGFTMSGTFAFALLLSVPWPAAVLAILLGSVVVDVGRAGRASDVRVAFNAAQFVIAVTGSIATMHVLAGDTVLAAGAPLQMGQLLAIMPAAAAMYMVNLLLTGVVVAMLSDARLMNVIREDLGPVDLLTHLLLTGLAPVFVVSTQRHLVLTAFLSVAVIAVYRSTKTAAQRRHESHHDALTGLPNRRMLDERIDEVIESATRREEGLAIMLLDLDGFKGINDRLGHKVGDQLLVGVAERLQQVPDIDILARLGGDEFAIVVRGVSQPGAVDAIAGDIVDAVGRPFELDDAPLRIGGSLGVALHPDHGSDMPTLLGRADAAMYHAKRNAEGWALATTRPGDSVLSPSGILADLPGAIAAEEIELAYQPKVDLLTGRVTGFEALARWRHPELGLLSPGSFVPVIESTELMGDLTHAVLATAIRQLATWRASGLDLPIAVNISARDLSDRRLVPGIVDLLATAGVPASALEVEITENSLMLDERHSEHVLRDLQATGAKVSIDDFGTGYSSLSRLRRLPIDVIKIDRSFVTDVDRDEPSAIIVESLVRLAHSMGLRVVAEGVETAHVLEVLEEIGCDEAQGYFMSPPLPPDEIRGWLAGYRAAAGSRRQVARRLDVLEAELSGGVETVHLDDHRTAPLPARLPAPLATPNHAHLATPLRTPLPTPLPVDDLESTS